MIAFPWQKLFWVLCHGSGMFWHKKRQDLEQTQRFRLKSITCKSVAGWEHRRVKRNQKQLLLIAKITPGLMLHLITSLIHWYAVSLSDTLTRTFWVFNGTDQYNRTAKCLDSLIHYCSLSASFAQTSANTKLTWELLGTLWVNVETQTSILMFSFGCIYRFEDVDLDGICLSVALCLGRVVWHQAQSPTTDLQCSWVTRTAWQTRSQRAPGSRWECGYPRKRWQRWQEGWKRGKGWHRYNMKQIQYYFMSADKEILPVCAWSEKLAHREDKMMCVKVIKWSLLQDWRLNNKGEVNVNTHQVSNSFNLIITDSTVCEMPTFIVKKNKKKVHLCHKVYQVQLLPQVLRIILGSQLMIEKEKCTHAIHLISACNVSVLRMVVYVAQTHFRISFIVFKLAWDGKSWV